MNAYTCPHCGANIYTATKITPDSPDYMRRCPACREDITIQKKEDGNDGKQRRTGGN